MELNALIAECTAYDFKVILEEKKPKSWLKRSTRGQTPCASGDRSLIVSYMINHLST